MTARLRTIYRLVPVVLLIAVGACGTEGPYNGALVAGEFIVGDNRVPFVLLDGEGARLEGAAVTVRFYRRDGNARELRAEAAADYYEVEGITPHVHEDGFVHQHMDVRGYYVVPRVQFDEPGVWEAEFEVTAGDAEAGRGAVLAVQASPRAVSVGEPAPPTRNATLAQTGDFTALSTRAVGLDNLHEVSVAEALGAGKPFVVAFASPRFCSTGVCGPVTDLVAELQGAYGERAAFIHIEPWDLQAARENGRLVPSDAMREWRLPSEPWVYVVGADGRVGARFEGIVSRGELQDALDAALAP